MVTAVTIPAAGLANATYEVRQRHGLDWPLVTASVAFDKAAASPARRSCLGFVRPKPWPAQEAAAMLGSERSTPSWRPGRARLPPRGDAAQPERLQGALMRRP